MQWISDSISSLFGSEPAPQDGTETLQRTGNLSKVNSNIKYQSVQNHHLSKT